MKNIKKKRITVISIILVSIWILSMFQNTEIIYGQPQYNEVTKTLTAPLSFSMYEFSEDIENKENVTSIDISLPSPSWNLTDIQVNFTDIDFNREHVNVETIHSNLYDPLNLYKPELAIQINITDPTILYGLEIFGSVQDPRNDKVFVQIEGYDSIHNCPNGTIFGVPIKINMSQELGWYYQNFTTSIDLPKGNYTLVLNGLSLSFPKDRNTEYRWYYNNSNPKYPDLHYSYYDIIDGKWSNGTKGRPYLYKLDRKLNYSFTPEEIDMRAEIKGDSYLVSNGIDPIKGELSIPNVDYSSATYTLPISIKNNKSSSLLFNATYRYNLKHILNSGGTVSIKESLNNTWTINPNFTRPSNNYSIKFQYPPSWFNLTVFNSTGELIESIDYIDDGQAIYILNDTITTDTGWKITANSEKVPFYAATQLDSYIPGQLLIIPMTLPPSIEKTNLTVVLLDRDGFLEYNYTDEDPPGTYIFEYPIPYNVIGGTWTALIYWNNGTDAGFQTVIFTITGTTPLISSSGGGGGGGSTVVTGIDPLLVFMGVLIIIIILAVSLTKYQVIKRYKIKQDEHRQKIFNKFKDVTNLNYVMIADKNSGLNVYEQAITGKGLDADLISGFLSAIRSFGIELTGSEDQSQSIRLEYKDSKILMSEFKDFRIINILEEAPSQDFLDSLEPLSNEIDKYYGKSFKDFDGTLDGFSGIKDLLEKHYNISLVYPLKVVLSKEIRLNSLEKVLAKKALNLMKKRNINHFFVSYLLADEEFNVQNAEAIISLIEKKVFRPIE